MLRGIGVKNFRSFSDEILIDIKPITVFVGKNSSGKSSLLRTFPLFRQSSEENTTGPILWYGRYVDFGDFSDVVSKSAPDNPIEFSFNVTLEERHINRARSRYYRMFMQKKMSAEVKLRIVSGKDKKTRTKEVKVILNDINYSIFIDENENARLVINYKDQVIERDGLVAKNLGNFIPSLSSRKKEEILNSSAQISPAYMLHGSNESESFENPIIDSVSKVLAEYFHNKTNIIKIKDGLKRIGATDEVYLMPMLKFIFREQKVFLKNADTSANEIINKLYPHVISWQINTLSTMLNSILIETYRSVKYIAPLRATSERFYRFQDLQVNEIDHTGSNLAMLLNSLTNNEKHRFESWTKENFAFSVKAKQVGAHFAVTISTSNNESDFNISDMGFGYSQVLPIITAIWIETENRENRGNRPITFIIEQPELHLHPAYQHNLAKIFAKVAAKAKENDIPISIIFETHSQNMIEALGECVESHDINISCDDISILVFDKDDNNKTSVRKSSFDENGFLTNWPIGFFSGAM